MDSKTYNNARNEIYRILNFFSGKYSVFIFRNDKSCNYTGVGIIEADKDILFSEEWLGRVSAEKGGYILITDNDAFKFNTPNEVISCKREYIYIYIL